jgi:hypothetical protein
MQVMSQVAVTLAAPIFWEECRGLRRHVVELRISNHSSFCSSYQCGNVSYPLNCRGAKEGPRCEPRPLSSVFGSSEFLDPRIGRP